MPPHNYNDMYWADMPEVAHKAATTLGYTKERWDADAQIPYDSKSFADCTNAEKQAAMFLNLSPIVKKLNVWWGDVDQTTKDHAVALGWSQEKWDDDWELEHLPVDQLYWADLDAKQQAAANHFGYTQATWNETWEDFSPSSGGAVSSPAPSATTAAAEAEKPEKKVFTPPPKGKVFSAPARNEDHKDEKKNDGDDDHHKFIKPFKKLFGKH